MNSDEIHTKWKPKIYPHTKPLKFLFKNLTTGELYESNLVSNQFFKYLYKQQSNKMKKKNPSAWQYKDTET